jgi:hypothetical protein
MATIEIKITASRSSSQEQLSLLQSLLLLLLTAAAPNSLCSRSKLLQFKIGNGNEFLDLFCGDKSLLRRH